MKERRCHIKHLKRGEWKCPINNTNTTSNQKKGCDNRCAT